MSGFSLILVLQFKTSKIINDMTKIIIKSQKITPFGGIVFKFISVPAKWIRTSRHYELNIYTSNHAYKNAFAITDG